MEGPAGAATLADPVITLYDLANPSIPTLVRQNDNWPSNQTHRDAFAATGEAPFPDGGKDAVLLAILQPGLCALEAIDVVEGDEIAMVELHEYP